jgi:hypothetical protein
MGYQPRNNIVKDEKGDLVINSHRILARWRNIFSQLLNVLVPEPRAFEVEKAIEKLKRHKSPGIDQIPAELIKEAVGKFCMRSIDVLILFGIRRSCQKSGRSRRMHLFVRRVIKQILVIIEAYYFLQLHSKLYPTCCCQG